ncbi:hypothetical protein NPA07_03950 [Mycoplasmopsis caviae]|uniref:Uncharacterized protein n=1 Tax=Mycoplasmopsis caviae TaxID=55603 RepID=A0A3P8MFB4_9BACT|nr:hypothetical protein [Mycoplasmopsis caviae]UUD34938.1 hypothetical protein NPA07_03950 [Mycoplasmopsis caviae]VDR42233.1 Uncharacterised protein [Mycoplasmopsis caviae]
MKKLNIKAKTIIWAIIGFLGIIGVIVCSILISRVNQFNALRDKVELENKIVEIYNNLKAYAIGLLSFSIVIVFIGAYITYAGIRSWHYSVIL